MKIKLLVEGGDMKPGPTIGQKLGPLGINIGKVIEEVNKSTQSFKGIKVPVELDIDPKTKNFLINVSSPPTSELLKKELGIEKASGEAGKKAAGNASIEQIIKVAKSKQDNLLSKDFKDAVKSVVGTCVSLGLLIENKEPKQILEEIEQGKYDKEIKEQRTETSKEKREKLDKFFNIRKAKQEELEKVEEEKEKEKAEEAEEKGEKEEKQEKEEKKEQQ